MLLILAYPKHYAQRATQSCCADSANYNLATKKARDASYSAGAEYTRTTRIVSNQNVQELSTEKTQ